MRSPRSTHAVALGLALAALAPATAVASSGMDWGDAVVGAGGAVVLLALTAGGTPAIRRRQVAAPRTPAAA